jgi:putative aldouronate transport system substrate-binding protein
MKRLLWMSLLAFCIVGFAFGAGDREATAPGPVSLRVMMSYGSVQDDADFDNLYWTRYVEEKFNVELRYEPVPASIAAERARIAFASGDLADVLLGTIAGAIRTDAIRAGQYVQLDELIENGTGWINNPYWDWIRPAVTEADGHIYTLGSVNFAPASKSGGGRFFWNVKWLQELGLEEPETIDELDNALRLVKEAHPDAIMISGLYSDRRIHGYFMNAFGMKSDWGGGLGNHINYVDGKVVFSPAHPNYRPYLEYMNRLYREGYLDPEYFTQTDSQLVARSREHGYFLFSHAAQSTLLGVDNPQVFDYRTARPLRSDYNPDAWWPLANPAVSGRLAIPSTSAKVDKAWEIADWMGSVEGVLLGTALIPPEFLREDLLPEGVRPEDVLRTPGPNGQIQLVPNWTWPFLNTYMALRGSGAPEVVTWGRDTPYAELVGVQEFPKEEPGTMLHYWMEQVLGPHYRPVIRGGDLKFTPDETGVLDQYAADLWIYMDEMHAKFIMGVEPLTAYDSYVNDLDRYGLAQVSDVYTDAYQRYLEIIE